MPSRDGRYTFKGFTHDQADSIRVQAKAFWDAATRAQEPFFRMINDCERVARVQLPKELADKFENVTDMAHLVPADAYINLRSTAANIYKLLFSRKPYGRLTEQGKPNMRSERLTKAEWLLQSLLDSENDGMGYESEAVPAIYQTLYAGISCTFTRWVTNFERKLEGIKDQTAIFKRESVGEYPETVHLDIRRVRIDPSVSNLKDRRIVGFESVTQFSKLQIEKRNKNSFIDFNEDELYKTHFDREEYYQYVEGEAQAYADRGGENPNFGDKLMLRREIHGMFRIEPENGEGAPDFKDCVVVLSNNNTLIGLKENDLPIDGWDLFDFSFISPESSRAFRAGLVEPMMDTLMEKFIKRNQSLDQASRDIHEGYVGDRNACQSLGDYIEYENGKINLIDVAGSGLADVRQAFAAMPKRTPSGEAFKEAASLGQDLQNGMFLNNYILGLDPSRADTATAVDALVSSSTSILELTMILLKWSMFAPNWRKHLILYNFFKGQETNVIYDSQGNPIQILPNDLDYFFQIDIDIATAIDQPAMVRRFVESFPTMINDGYYDQYELRKTFVDVLGLPNGEKILKPPQYIQEVIERENIALINGLGLFVSQFDPHSAHIIGHTQARDLALQQGLPTQAIDAHILEHQEMQMALQEQMKGLANTKAFGGSSGQNLNAENAANKSIPAAGGQRRRVA